MLLSSVIETLIAGEHENLPADSSDSRKADTGAAFGQNDSEFNIFFTDRQLAALQTAAQMLGRLNEKKSLIYFASGLRLNGANNQAQLQATINAAIRAGVSLWPIDTRGPAGSGADGRCVSALSRWTLDVHRGHGPGSPVGPERFAGHAVDPGGRHRRQGAARLQRPDTRYSPGSAIHRELLHPRLLQHQRQSRWKATPHQDHPRERTTSLA